MTIGEKIKMLRTQQGYTQEELADAAKTTKQTIHKYETGIITNIPASKIKALADKLNSTPAYLMGWQTEVKEPTITNLSKYTEHHIKVIDAYIAKPEMQPAVDKLLGIMSDNYSSSIHLSDTPYVAAQSGKKIKAGTPNLKALIEIEKSK